MNVESNGIAVGVCLISTVCLCSDRQGWFARMLLYLTKAMGILFHINCLSANQMSPLIFINVPSRSVSVICSARTSPLHLFCVPRKHHTVRHCRLRLLNCYRQRQQPKPNILRDRKKLYRFHILYLNPAIS